MVGLLAFESSMDPFVKNTMRAKFPLSSAEADAQDAFEAFEAAECDKLRELPQLLRAAREALHNAQNAATADRKTKIQAVGAAKKKLKDLQDFRPTFDKRRKKRRQQYVQPRWVQKCQAVVGPSMKAFTTFDRQWDMYTHAEVITGHLRDIFVPAIGCGPYEFEAKELLDKLRLASQGRLRRAHPEDFEKPREAEVLDFLGTMCSVLKLCGCVAGVKNVWKVLEEAQDLMEQAVAPVSGAPTPSSAPRYRVVSLSLKAFERHMLYVATYDFAQRLQRLVGRFRFKEASVSIPGAEEGNNQWPSAWQKRVKQAKTRLKIIAQTRAALSAWQKRVKQAKTRLKIIAQARAALFHSDHDKWQDVDVMLTLQTMGEVLQWLHPGPLAAVGGGGGSHPPAATWGPCPVDWRHHTNLAAAVAGATAPTTPPSVPLAAAASAGHSSAPKTIPSPRQVRLRVCLQLSDGGMRIPIAEETNFVGRDGEMAELEKALLPKGARVLVHGIAGVGKDTLVAETLRAKCARVLKGVRTMAWLQGSTDAAFRRQLIDHFRTHQRAVLRGRELDPKACLESIYRWLRANGGWLFYVEDATRECRALFECVPMDVPHGRVVVTSKERLDYGGAAVLRGLRTNVNLNGESVTILRKTKGRFAVRLSSGRELTVNPENLTAVCGALPPRTHTIELLELKLDQSKRIWRNMNIFSAFVTKSTVRRAREQELRSQCEASGGRVQYVCAPADGETAKSSDERHNRMHEALQQLRPTEQREKARAAKMRLKREAVAQLEAQELGRAGLDEFLEDTLGNLPLSVRLCGQMLYASQGE